MIHNTEYNQRSQQLLINNSTHITWDLRTPMIYIVAAIWRGCNWMYTEYTRWWFEVLDTLVYQYLINTQTAGDKVQ